LRQALLVELPGKAEVGTFRRAQGGQGSRRAGAARLGRSLALPGQQHIGRLEVAVNDLVPVRMVNG
jgi:hypothetical protein